ncbi:MAG TPA: translation elongation factor Ts [Bryobacteraceae bacterium]|nr:translation elongation factor Ts [Bryobacteraceae bacterium]
MMEISAQLVKQLREKTGAGMMECKKALTESKGDLTEAEVILRKKGIASATSKASRSTKQGVIGTYIHQGSQLGVLIEVNCESDFVARTQDFQQLVQDLAIQVAEADPQFVRREDAGSGAQLQEERCLYGQPFVKDRATIVSDLIKSVIAKLGENISVSRFVRFKIGEGKRGVIGTYLHAGAQIGVLIEVNCESDSVSRSEEFQVLVHDLAMQVAAADPGFLRKEDVTESALVQEREIQRARAREEGKPDKMLDKIVEGRMNKFYEEVCLYEQPFIKENTTTISDLIKSKIAKLGENISVSRFARFKVGDSASADSASAE